MLHINDSGDGFCPYCSSSLNSSDDSGVINLSRYGCGYFLTVNIAPINLYVMAYNLRFTYSEN